MKPANLSPVELFRILPLEEREWQLDAWTEDELAAAYYCRSLWTRGDGTLIPDAPRHMRLN